MTRTASPGQTVGPFFHFALPYDGDRALVAPGAPGSVLLHGVVYDGAGDPVPDALVEIWQADPHGHVVQEQGSLHREGSFTGFGRCATDANGCYAFSTLPPGGMAGGLPFFAVVVFARGLTHRLLTRAYLPPADGATDAVLTAAGERAATLVCVADQEGFRFDIRLQGDGETVFLTARGD